MDEQELLEFNPGYFNSSWLPSPWSGVLLLLAEMRTLFLLGLFAFATWLICIPYGVATAVLAIAFGSISAIIGLIALANCDLFAAADWKWNWGNASRTIFISECSGMVVAAILGVFGGGRSYCFWLHIGTCSWALTSFSGGMESSRGSLEGS